MREKSKEMDPGSRPGMTREVFSIQRPGGQQGLSFWIAGARRPAMTIDIKAYYQQIIVKGEKRVRKWIRPGG